jgi:hypothetical protein
MAQFEAMGVYAPFGQCIFSRLVLCERIKWIVLKVAPQNLDSSLAYVKGQSLVTEMLEGKPGNLEKSPLGCRAPI